MQQSFRFELFLEIKLNAAINDELSLLPLMLFSTTVKPVVSDFLY